MINSTWAWVAFWCSGGLWAVTSTIAEAVVKVKQAKYGYREPNRIHINK